MGIKTPSKIVYSIDDVSSEHLRLLVTSRRDLNDPSKDRRPHIALDASVYAHKWKQKGSAMPAHIVNFAAHMANALSADVTIYCDRTSYRST